jgi:hypothetical protein
MNDVCQDWIRPKSSLGRAMPCGRAAKENGKCGIHARAERQRAERDREYALSWISSENNFKAASERISKLRDAGVFNGSMIPVFRGNTYTGGINFSPDAVDTIIELLNRESSL